MRPAADSASNAPPVASRLIAAQNETTKVRIRPVYPVPAVEFATPKFIKADNEVVKKFPIRTEYLMRAASGLAAVLAALASCAAQISSTVTLSNGVQLEVVSNLGTPTGQQTITVEMVRASGKSFYRIFRDQSRLAVFAYELVVDLVSNGERLSVVAKPVETEFAARFPAADGGKPVPTLSSDQQAGMLASGQSADIGLFELQGMGLKVIDTVRMRLDQKQGAASGRIQFSGLRVSLGGKQVSGTVPAAVSGRYAMFYIPGRGGFFFAIEQPPPDRPFIQAGTIDHNRMRFTIDNENYEAVASAPIVANPDTADLWVYHDPSYQPEGNWTQNLRSGTAGSSAASDFFTAASDSLAWWFEHHEPRP